MPGEFTGVIRGECPYCPGTAELEEEDGLRKWVCLDCGGEYGHARLSQPEEACSLGIPEAVRADLMFRQLSETQRPPSGPVLLGLPTLRSPEK